MPESPLPRRTPTPLSSLRRRRRRKLVELAALGLAMAVLWSIHGYLAPEAERAPEPVPLSVAVDAIAAGEVASVVIDDSSRQVLLELKAPWRRITVAQVESLDARRRAVAEKRPAPEPVAATPDKGPVTRVVAAYPALYGTELVKLLVAESVPATTANLPKPNFFLDLVRTLVPLLLLMGFLVYLMRKMGGGHSKLSKGKGTAAAIPATRFCDVAGADEALEDLREVVEYLHNPDRFTSAGAKVPHGVLLVGPPGTGKTLLARAVAGEAGVPFFAMSGSDFVETFVGVGASRMRQVFEKARGVEKAIVFIDELDAVGKARTSGPGSNGASEERENTLNALLVEMDGFVASGVIVLGATNRADVLDPALTRPGRFDRTITVPAPDRAGRTAILALYAKAAHRRFDEDVDFVSLARRTPGLTGADLSFLINEAALVAARAGSDRICAAHLDSALATSVLGRERRSAIITDRDRSITAWHEAGHALCALVLPDAEDPVSLTIVPRGVAGGVTWMGGNDNSFLTKRECVARLAIAMGGRAGEERLLDGDFSQGASSDLASATTLATEMITHYGMGRRGLSYLSRERFVVGGLDEVDSEVDSMLAQALTDARELLGDHAGLLEAVVAELLVEETLHTADLYRLAAEHPPASAAAAG